jgi:flagellar basal body-associated protein FliL
MASNLGTTQTAADENSTSSTSTEEATGTQKKKGGSAAIPLAAGVAIALAAAATLAWRLLKNKGADKGGQQQLQGEGAAAEAGDVDEAEALEKARKAAAGVNAMAAGEKGSFLNL